MSLCFMLSQTPLRRSTRQLEMNWLQFHRDATRTRRLLRASIRRRARRSVADAQLPALGVPAAARAGSATDDIATSTAIAWAVHFTAWAQDRCTSSVYTPANVAAHAPATSPVTRAGRSQVTALGTSSSAAGDTGHDDFTWSAARRSTASLPAWTRRSAPTALRADGLTHARAEHLPIGASSAHASGRDDTGGAAGIVTVADLAVFAAFPTAALLAYRPRTTATTLKDRGVETRAGAIERLLLDRGAARGSLGGCATQSAGRLPAVAARVAVRVARTVAADTGAARRTTDSPIARRSPDGTAETSRRATLAAPAARILRTFEHSAVVRSHAAILDAECGNQRALIELVFAIIAARLQLVYRFADADLSVCIATRRQGAFPALRQRRLPFG
jgi:hypothetical protein